MVEASLLSLIWAKSWLQNALAGNYPTLILLSKSSDDKLDLFEVLKCLHVECRDRGGRYAMLSQY